MNARVPARTENPLKPTPKTHPFNLDDRTVFLADFDGNTQDKVSGIDGADGFDIPFRGILGAVRISGSVRGPAEIARVWQGIAKQLK